MAASDKNIVIQPQRGSTTLRPSITFTGDGNDPITLNVPDGLGTLSFESSAGQLFSITNNLSTGSIFSVNDISGIPSINVEASGTIQLAPYSSSDFVGVGTLTPQSKLDVRGQILENGLNIVSQLDIGYAPNQVPLNQFLGRLAFLDEFGLTIPQNAQTAAYTLTRDDNGKHVSITTGGVTVPAGVFEIGDNITVYNNSASSQTLVQGASVTLRLTGTGLTGNRTIAQHGLATILCVASNTFVVGGGGIT
jgi:hypothetical protein